MISHSPTRSNYNGRMVSKYIKIIQFNQEVERKDQVEIARKEIQVVLEIRERMRFFLDLDFTKQEDDIVVQLAKELQ